MERFMSADSRAVEYHEDEKQDIYSKFVRAMWNKYDRFRNRRSVSNVVLHAKRELLAAGYAPDDKEEGPNKWIQENILELLDVFSKQGHSGFSASYCIHAFATLAKFEPLTPLTDADDEWNEVADGVKQNNRCNHVFKQPDRFNGQAYDIEGIIFKSPDGSCFTSSDSFVPITFPYYPKKEYRDVPE